MDGMGRANVVEPMGDGALLCAEHMMPVDKEMVCAGCLKRDQELAKV